METDTALQKVFELCVKHGDGTLAGSNAKIRRVLRWAAYYRRLFIVWADVNRGEGKRVAAAGIAWRTEALDPHLDDPSIEHTEFGSNLFVLQTVVHPDFRHSGVLFQLLSLALWRFPGVDRVYWHSEHSASKRDRAITIARLTSILARQTNPYKLRPFMRRQSWEAVRAPKYQILKPVQ